MSSSNALSSAHPVSLDMTQTDSLTINLSRLLLQSKLNIDPDMSPREIARYLWEGNATPEQISTYLTQKNDKTSLVLNEYMTYYDFKDLSLDDALRKFTSTFCLIGESQQVDRILEQFSHQYYIQNPQTFSSQDTVLVLSHALVILNTDLYNRHNRRKMKRSKFVENCHRALGKDAVSESMLCGLYNSIKSRQIMLPQETLSLMKANSVKSSATLLAAPASLFKRWTTRTTTSMKSFSINFTANQSNISMVTSSLVHGVDEGRQLMSEGLLYRKHVIEKFDRRAKHRNWKPFFVVLEGSELFFYKPLSASSKYERKWIETIVVRHAVAKAVESKAKHSNLFSLETSTGAYYLFETSSAQSQVSWMDAINRMAALHSAPPLPSPIGSQMVEFMVPAAPSCVTRLTESQQLEFIARKLQQLQLDIHRQVDERLQLLKAKDALQPSLHGSSTMIESHSSKKNVKHALASLEPASLASMLPLLTEPSPASQQMTNRLEIDTGQSSTLYDSLSVTEISRRLHNWEKKMNYLNWEQQKYQIYLASFRNQSHFLTVPRQNTTPLTSVNIGRHSQFNATTELSSPASS